MGGHDVLQMLHTGFWDALVFRGAAQRLHRRQEAPLTLIQLGPNPCPEPRETGHRRLRQSVGIGLGLRQRAALDRGWRRYAAGLLVGIDLNRDPSSSRGWTNPDPAKGEVFDALCCHWYRHEATRDRNECYAR